MVALATTIGLAACSDSGSTTASTASSEVATSAAAAEKQTSARTADAALTVKDAAGRTIEFAEMPDRIVLAEGRAAYATALL